MQNLNIRITTDICMIQIIVNTQMNSNYSTHPSSYENQLYHTNWLRTKITKIKWNHLSICHSKQVISFQKSEFSCIIRISSWWTSSTDDCRYIWFDINRCIKYININQNTSYGNSILSYLVQHHMNP